MSLSGTAPQATNFPSLSQYLPNNCRNRESKLAPFTAGEDEAERSHMVGDWGAWWAENAQGLEFAPPYL